MYLRLGIWIAPHIRYGLCPSASFCEQLQSQSHAVLLAYTDDAFFFFNTHTTTMTFRENLIEASVNAEKVQRGMPVDIVLLCFPR